MQLNCPNCGEKITAENINIQKMVAVCSACHTVFPFDLPETRAKRRKVKQPEKLTVRETEHGLNLAFRTNFRLDKNESFVFIAVLNLVFTVMTILVTGGYLASDVPVLVPVVFGLASLFSYYFLSLIVYNKTHIDIDDEHIAIARRPVPGLFDSETKINHAGVVSVRYEETPASKQEGYDTPRYRVWAEMADGNRKTIVNDVIDDYAVFITQRLNEFLDFDAGADISRLVDQDQEVQETEGAKIQSAGGKMSEQDH